MSVSDEAVEAAARAFYGDAYEDVFDADKEHALAQMRDTLTAAAPFIAAQALEEAASKLQETPEPAPWPAGLRDRLIATGWLKK